METLGETEQASRVAVLLGMVMTGFAVEVSSPATQASHLRMCQLKDRIMMQKCVNARHNAA